MISTLSDFFEMGKSFIAFLLSNKGEIPVFEIFNPFNTIRFIFERTYTLTI